MVKTIDFYGEELNAYKANLHMHSTNSDGKYSPQEILDIYKKEEYEILAATDHYTTNDISKVDSGDLLMISGMEFHPVGPRGLLLHLVALNLPLGFENPSKLEYQEAIDKVKAAGGETILAHPYWCGLNCSDIMQIKNLVGLEVFNTDTELVAKGYSMQVWDNVIQLGYHLPAVAVDDTHRDRDLFGGWTMICAKEKTTEAFMESIRKGRYYSSQGPEIYKLEFKNNIFKIVCSPCTEIYLLGNGSFGKCATNSRIHVKSPEDAKNLQAEEKSFFEVEVPVDSSLTYVRCQIRDKEGRYAWTNPITLS